MYVSVLIFRRKTEKREEWKKEYIKYKENTLPLKAAK